MCIVLGFIGVPVGFAADAVSISLAGAGGFVFGLIVLVSGYVIGILEDIRDAVIDRDETAP